MPSTSKQIGQGLVEYALILVLIALVVTAILSMLGPATGNVFSDIVGAASAEGLPSQPDSPEPTPTSHRPPPASPYD